MPNTYAHLGEAIRASREAQGLSQAELCIRLGWNPNRKGHLSAIENGSVADLKLSRIVLFAHALSLPVLDLVDSVTYNPEAV